MCQKINLILYPHIKVTGSVSVCLSVSTFLGEGFTLHSHPMGITTRKEKNPCKSFFYFYRRDMSNKVVKHPDREVIIKKLLDGESVKNVDIWLKSKYPKQTRYHISYVTLQKFRKENLDKHVIK